MTSLYVIDDEIARSFEPFALTRPVAEMRSGAELIRVRWERALGARAEGFISAPHLADFQESGAPPSANGTIPAGAIVASSRCAVSLAPAAGADVWLCAGRTAAVRLARDTPAAELSRRADALAELGSGATAAIDGWWMDGPWDFIRNLTEQLSVDIPVLATNLDCENAGGDTVFGDFPAFIERRARIEPYVVIDVTAGPVLVRRGATVAAFTRLVGPCIIGEGSIVAGGRVGGSSIGEACRVHGELSVSIFLGHANKAHDGFVGHSYLGRWVNLGASTVTSNLKNTYGTVQLWTPHGLRDTKMQFLGTLFGDHAKTAVGTRLTTGTVVGAGANVFATGMTSKVVPPFSWGGRDDSEAYDVDRFLVVAERVMARRHVALEEGGRRQLRAAHAARWSGST